MPGRKNDHHGLVPSWNRYAIIEMHRCISAFRDNASNIVKRIIDVAKVKVFARCMNQLSNHSDIGCINSISLKDIRKTYLEYFSAE